METFGNLQISTPTDLEIVLTRDFNAPRSLVWDAVTKPELIKRWMLGPPGWTMPICENDATVGSAYRWVWRNEDDKSEMSLSGVYREVEPIERIVRTEIFDFGCNAQAGSQVGTMVLTEQGSKTKLAITVLFPSKEARDGAVASGMAKGMEAGFDRLDEVLASTPV